MEWNEVEKGFNFVVFKFGKIKKNRDELFEFCVVKMFVRDIVNGEVVIWRVEIFIFFCERNRIESIFYLVEFVLGFIVILVFVEKVFF